MIMICYDYDKKIIENYDDNALNYVFIAGLIACDCNWRVTYLSFRFFPKHCLLTGAEERFVGAGENTILECEEARHQPGLSSVEWFCRLMMMMMMMVMMVIMIMMIKMTVVRKPVINLGSRLLSGFAGASSLKMVIIMIIRIAGPVTKGAFSFYSYFNKSN